MYAVIEDSGSQIKVTPGALIKVDLRDLEADQTTLSFDKVLLIADPDDEAARKIGAPYVKGASVTGELLGEKREAKVVGVKFRRRKNYRRQLGHRQPYLSVKITAINA